MGEEGQKSQKNDDVFYEWPLDRILKILDPLPLC